METPGPPGERHRRPARPATERGAEPNGPGTPPDSDLVGVVCAPDPVLPVVTTPHGEIEVRRLVGVDERELDRVETWSARGFVEELRRHDPLLLSPTQRPSLMDDPAFATAVDDRAAREGSEIDAAMFDVEWSPTADGARIDLPAGRGADRLLAVIQGRPGFGRRLVTLLARCPPLVFEPTAVGLHVHDHALVIGGGLDAPGVDAIVRALREGRESVTLTAD
jgi:hypothetical protein